MNPDHSRSRGKGFRLAAATLLLGVQANVASAAAAQPASEIGRTDPIRSVLLDALRPTVEADLDQKVIFVVHVLRREGDWAFADVAPRTPAGAPIDFSRTRHAERQREGVLDGDTVYALLRLTGSKWRVVAYAIGPTDVAWAGWADEHGAPKQLFRLPD